MSLHTVHCSASLGLELHMWFVKRCWPHYGFHYVANMQQSLQRSQQRSTMLDVSWRHTYCARPPTVVLAVASQRPDLLVASTGGPMLDCGSSVRRYMHWEGVFYPSLFAWTRRMETAKCMKKAIMPDRWTPNCGPPHYCTIGAKSCGHQL